MRLYLDDDSAATLLARLLRQARHDVQLPSDVALSGESDAIHLRHAVRENRILLTGNYRDFFDLHNLVVQVGGHHPGIIVVRRDNDPKRDLTPPGIVRTIGNLTATGIAPMDQFVILNHWR